MTKLSAWKMACAISLLCGAMGIAAPAQTFTTLYSFDYKHGAAPQNMALIQGADGNFYGTTPDGGSQKGGTAFEISAGGTSATLYNFCSGTNCGVVPLGGLVQGTNG